MIDFIRMVAAECWATVFKFHEFTSTVRIEFNAGDVRHEYPLQVVTNYGLDLRYGLMAVRVIDWPNEADIAVADFWGVGYSPTAGLVVPWRRTTVDI